MCIEQPHRILAAVVRMREQIAGKNQPQAKLDELHKSLDMDAMEFCKLQELKSLAFAMNVLTLDEGNYIYGLLGNEPGHFNAQPLAEKCVVTQVMKELLRWKMRQG